MSTAREEHGKGASNEGAPRRASREKTRPAAGNETKQLIFTLNAETGAVITIEMVDPEGKRHEVPKEEVVALAGKGNLHEIETALDEAFEAGISSVLEPTGDDISPEEAEEETEEDRELRRVLLTRLIRRDVRRRLQRRFVQRLMLSQTLKH